MNPGNRPRRGLLVVLGLIVAGAAVLVPIALDTEQAAADELEPFASCEELRSWEPADDVGGAVDEDGAATTAAGAAEGGGMGGGDDATASAPAPTAGREADTASNLAATGDTNVIVEGVDELDVVDRIDDTHVLITNAEGGLRLVDLSARAVVAAIDGPYGGRVSYDAERSVVWLLGSDDEGRTVVQRVVVGDGELTVDGEWTTSGWLVDARRTGDRLHVVVAESFFPEGDVVPFAEGPVPCDRVLHPAGPSAPAATLLVTLPASGALEPTAATEVVGSGELVHVTTGAAYLATPQWDGDEPATSIHRFDLADLTHTGSGRVDGTLLNQFSMSDHDGHLRVALTHGGGRFGRPIDDVAVLEGGAAPPDEPVASDIDTATDSDADATSVDADPATDPAAGTGTAAAPVTIEPVPEPDTVPPDTVESDVTPLNEIVVLDTDGDLDEVGRTDRFGHEGETLHGVRFDGDVAYAVTFLVTDPFYVVDLADPAAPVVAGEVELPGFSAYLHPIGDGLVAGFGPGENGGATVKLFDVSDPATPHLLDSKVLGDESAVVWDHHAFLGLGEGRFAVPASVWRPEAPAGCTEAVRQERQAQIDVLQGELDLIFRDQTPDVARLTTLQSQLDRLYADPCVNPPYVVDTTVVVGTVGASGIDIDRPVTVTGVDSGTRVLTVDGGWAVLAGSHLIVVQGDTTTDLDLT